MNYKHLILLSLLPFSLSCGDDEPNLTPPEERVEKAIQDFRNELIAPPNGWKVKYKPTSESGVFFMLLNFDAEGNVNIQSDVPANEGEFRNQNITYRIDNSLGVELIFETYGVFHFLFELDRSSFGAEFEFFYKGKQGENLLFESKTDIFDVSTIIFEPAGTNDDDLFGIEIARNLNEFEGLGLADEATRQQLILSDRSISIFWAIDLEKRNLFVEFAGIGTTIEEVISNPIVIIDHLTSYSFEGDAIVLEESFSFVLNGFNNEISQIRLGQFESTGPSLCSFGPDNNPIFSDQSPGLGNIIIQNTALSSSGIGFTANVYTVNSFFIFDEEGNSLADDEENTGLIIENFPGVAGFAFLYGVELNDPTIPIYSLGMIMDDGDLYFREFTPTETEINRVSIELLDKFFYRTEPEGSAVPAGTEEALIKVTDAMFEGGQIYAYDFPINGFQIFRLFNPCNGLDFLLVQ